MTNPADPPLISVSSQAVADRANSFTEALERDKKHRKSAKSIRPLQRLVPFVMAYPGLLIMFLIMLIAASGVSLLIPFAGRYVIDCGFGETSTSTNCGFLPVGGGLSIYFIAGFVLAIILGITSGLRFYYISRLGERVVADLRKTVYDHLLTLRPSFYSRVHTGEVLSRLTTDTTLIQTLVGSSVSLALRTAATTVGAIIMMIVTNWQLSLMVLIVGPLILVPLIMFGRRTQRLSRDSQDRLAAASTRASETLRAIETIQAFTREPQERSNFADAVEMTYKASMDRIISRSMLTVLLFSFVLCALVAVLWFGAVQVLAGVISAGELTQFLLFAVMAVGGGGLLSETYAEIMRAAGASERLMELLATKSDIKQSATPAVLPQPFKGEIEFEAVSFRYPTRKEQPALIDLNLRVKPGETLALVGPSGAGKTTVFQLLLRLYDPEAGTIKLDGKVLDNLKVEDVRRVQAVVGQNAPLFADTVRNNILFGRENATDAEIIDAAKAANAHEFIQALPQGYETILSEGAVNLSGGQRQRLAIARAILRDAAILLLDEATSALDSESEAAIQQAFEKMSAARTSIVIAHRLATVRSADKIVVLDQGRVVDQGRHEELLQRGGLYKRLVELQFGKDQKSKGYERV